MDVSILFIILVIIVLFVIGAAQIPGEEKYGTDMERFISRETFGKTVVKRDCTDKFQLKSNEELWIFGIDHSQAIGWPWKLSLIAKEKIVYATNADEQKDMYYVIKVASRPSKGCIIIDDEFRIDEIVWTKRFIIQPMVYVVTYPTV